MSTVLMFLAIIGAAGPLTIMSHKRLEEQLPIAAAAMIALMYAFGLAGRLVAGWYAVLAGCALGLFLTLFTVIRKWKSSIIRLFLTPGSLFLLLIFGWLFLCFRQHAPFTWDDFSHWMLAVKNTMLWEAFPSAVEEATVSYRSYPPGATLFAYFWTRLSGAFNEGDPQRAMNLLTLCFLLPAMRKQTFQHWFSALSMAGILFLLPLVYHGRAYQTVYVDILMGCIMLHAVSTWFLCEHDGHTLASVCASLFLLPLLKDSGSLMGLMVLMILAIDLLLAQKHWHLKKRTGYLTGLIVALALPLITWNGYLLAHGIQDAGAVSFHWSAVFDVLHGKGEVYQQKTIENFLHRLASFNTTGDDGRIEPSLLLLMAVYAAVSFCIAAFEKDQQRRKRWKIGLWGVGIGFAVYLCSLLAAYLFGFKPYEAVHLVSFARYLSSYLVLLTGFLVFVIEECARRRWRFRRLSACFCLLICLLVPADPASVLDNTIRANQYASKMQMALDEYVIPRETASQLDPENDKLFLVARQGEGLSFFMSAYRLTPVKTQPGNKGWWMLLDEEQKKAADMYVSPYTEAVWVDLLLEDGYTHVYCISEDFESSISERLYGPEMIKAEVLYEIQPYKDGVKLEAIPPVIE